MVIQELLERCLFCWWRTGICVTLRRTTDELLMLILFLLFSTFIYLLYYIQQMRVPDMENIKALQGLHVSRGLCTT